jgi:hypothetical protein
MSRHHPVEQEQQQLLSDHHSIMKHVWGKRGEVMHESREVKRFVIG